MSEEGFEGKEGNGRGKGNGKKSETNNKKGNEGECFPFPFLITFNQTPPNSFLRNEQGIIL